MTLNSDPSSLPLTPKCCFELANTLFSHLLCGDLPPRTLCSVSVCVICYLGLLHPGILFFLSVLSWGLDTILWIQLFSLLLYPHSSGAHTPGGFKKECLRDESSESCMFKKIVILLIHLDYSFVEYRILD